MRIGKWKDKDFVRHQSYRGLDRKRPSFPEQENEWSAPLLDVWSHRATIHPDLVEIERKLPYFGGSLWFCLHIDEIWAESTRMRTFNRKEPIAQTLRLPGRYIIVVYAHCASDARQLRQQLGLVCLMRWAERRKPPALWSTTWISSLPYEMDKRQLAILRHLSY